MQIRCESVRVFDPVGFIFQFAPDWNETDPLDAPYLFGFLEIAAEDVTLFQVGQLYSLLAIERVLRGEAS